jgi:radical SAM protein with 4Fe4S-binding SPASM domain
MLNLTRLLGAPAAPGDDLRYDPRIPQAGRGALPDRGPVVVWNWTRTCNLACAHCYASAVRGRAPGELATAEAEDLLAELAAMRVPALLLSGGEPLARPDALHLLGAAHGLGLRCTLSTNGTLIDDTRADALAQAAVTYVGVSLDGPPDVHDAWRGARGAHAASLAAIRRLRRRGIRVGLRFTLHRASIPHIRYLLDLAEGEGISRICFYHLVPIGRGESLGDLGLSRAEARGALEALLDRAAALLHAGGGTEILTVGNHSDGAFAYLWMRRHAPDRAAAALRLLRRNGGNRSGVGMVCVDPTGGVHPDQFSWDVDLGNVRQLPLRRIWDGGPAAPLLDALRSRRSRITGPCAACAWFPVCNGNLRARAGAAGDFWGSDPACVLYDDERNAEGVREALGS